MRARTERWVLQQVPPYPCCASPKPPLPDQTSAEHVVDVRPHVSLFNGARLVDALRMRAAGEAIPYSGHPRLSTENFRCPGFVAPNCACQPPIQSSLGHLTYRCGLPGTRACTCHCCWTLPTSWPRRRATPGTPIQHLHRGGLALSGAFLARPLLSVRHVADVARAVAIASPEHAASLAGLFTAGPCSRGGKGFYIPGPGVRGPTGMRHIGHPGATHSLLFATARLRSRSASCRHCSPPRPSRLRHCEPPSMQ